MLALRVVFVNGVLDGEAAARIAAELMTLDATGTDPVDVYVDCANGTFHVRSGRIRLRSRIRCEGIDKHVFARARIVYDRAWHDTRRFGIRHVGCPNH